MGEGKREGLGWNKGDRVYLQDRNDKQRFGSQVISLTNKGLVSLCTLYIYTQMSVLVYRSASEDALPSHF